MTDQPSEFDEPHRLHPISPIFDLIAGARQFLPALFVALVAGGGPQQLLFVAPLVVITLVRVLRWLRFSYWVEGRVLHVNEGTFVQKKRVIPFESIHQVDVITKLRHRVMGVVSLSIETGTGEGGADLHLDVIPAAEAARLRLLLEQPMGEPRPGPAVDESHFHEAPPGDSRIVTELSFGQVALAGMTGNKALVVLGVVGTAQQLIEPIAQQLESVLPDNVDPGPIGIVLGVVVGIAVWLTIAAIAAILADGEFRLATDGAELQTSKGLLDRRELRTSVARVQAVIVHQNLVRRWLKVAAIKGQTAATPGQVVGSLAVPLVPAADADRVVAAIIPGLPARPEWVPAPRPALRRAVLRRVIPFAVLGAVGVAGAAGGGAPAVAVLGTLAGSLLVLDLAALAGIASWQASATAWHPSGILWVRRGALFREMVVLRAARTQSLTLTTTPLQRRAGLASLTCHVAGSGATTSINDADVDRLEAILAAVPEVAEVDEARLRRA